MKKKLVTALLLTPTLWAADYHVDQASLSPTENGSQANPYKTIAQASAVMVAGDTCHIHRGIYRETLTPAQSGTSALPIRYVGYNNDPVVVSAASVITNWQPHSGSIYKATNVNLTLGNLNMLYFDSSAQQLARWPNDLDGDPYTIDAYPVETAAGTYSNSHITHNNIPDYWTSGVIYWLGAHSGCAVQRNITGFDPVNKQLSFTTFPSEWPFGTHSPTRYENGNRGRFYLLNRLEALDAPGEWYYDASQQTLYFHAPGSVNPATGTVEMAVRDKTLNLTKNHIHIEKLNFFGGQAFVSGNNCRLTNLRLRHCIAGLITDASSATAGGSAVAITGDNNRVEQCLIEEGSSTGVQISGTASGTEVINNHIRNFDQQGNHCSPIRVDGGPSTVSYNRIHGSGRDVTRVTGPNSVMSYNEVSDGLKICQDGGLFYVTGNSVPIHVELHHNWFYNAYSPGYTAGHATGIYLDNDSSGYKVHHNVVWDVQWGGLHFNWDALQNEIYNNTFWNTGAGEAQILCWIPENNGIRTDVRDNTLINNLSDVRPWWDSGAGSYTEDETLDNVFTNNVQVASPPFVSIPDKDFTPVNNGAIVDQGTVIPGVTDGYSGAAPDIGAYEYAAPRWIPGPDWEPAWFSWLLLAPPVEVAGVSVSPATIIVEAGQTLALTPHITPVDAANQSVTWSSNNPPVATVSPSGMVTAVTSGIATITATTVDGGHTASGTIVVTPNSAFPLYSYTFTGTDPNRGSNANPTLTWSDADTLASKSPTFNAQSSWVAANTSADGDASTSTNYQRAKVTTNYSLAIGDTVRIISGFRFASPSTSNTASVARFGFSHSAQHTGANLPDVHCEVAATADGSITVGKSPNVVTIPPAEAMDEFRLVLEFTRSTTVDSFDATVTVLNTTNAALVGSTRFVATTTGGTAPKPTDKAWGDGFTLNSGFSVMDVSGVSGMFVPHLSTAVINNPGTGFANWIANHGLTGQDALESADPDKDKRLNSIEYATGGNPTNGSDGGSDPRLELTQDSARFTHRLRNGILDFDFIVEHTDDLAANNWSPAGIAVSSITDLGSGLSEITYETPRTTDRRFFRLRLVKK